MHIQRRPTRQIAVGGVTIGGDAPIRVQSMCTTDTRDVAATVRQIQELEELGCELIRVAVIDKQAAESLGAIRSQIRIPLIADIHFNYTYALEAIESGCDGVRLNPGNIGNMERTKAVIGALRERSMPLRIGVNSGSVHSALLQKHGGPTPQALVESALEHIAVCEALDFGDIKISVKSTNLWDCVEAYRLLSRQVDYPLHIGITEAGLKDYGTVKSAIGLGVLVGEGIGDTIRVSLASDPHDEIPVCYDILKATGARGGSVEIIACPSCGRVEIDVLKLAEQVNADLKPLKRTIKVAVMGCVVNGPGEAREADYGIAGGRGQGVIFRRGEVFRKVKEQDLAAELKRVILEDLAQEAVV